MQSTKINTVKFTKQDFKETRDLATIINFCDQADNKTLEQVVDDIYRYQPFLISLFLGYKDDVTPHQHDELIRIIIIIWLFFKDYKGVKKQTINDIQFEQQQQKNVQFLQYLEGEPTLHAQSVTTELNLQQLQSKALFTAVLYRVLEGQHLQHLDTEEQGIMILSLKSLIECFESLS